jgi:hypothetical protein
VGLAANALGCEFFSFAFSSFSSKGLAFSRFGVPPPGVATCGVAMGRISVFSSLFFFGFGSGAVSFGQHAFFVFILSEKPFGSPRNSPLLFSCT